VVAKYRDEHVCLSVRNYISGTTRVILPIFLRMLPMAVAQSCSGRVTKSQGEGAVLGVFFPINNTL